MLAVEIALGTIGYMVAYSLFPLTGLLGLLLMINIDN